MLKQERLLNCSGVALPLVLILLPSLVYLVALAVNTSLSVLVQSQLQTAVDSASLSGALLLDGKPNGWRTARETAIEIVRRAELHTAIGSPLKVQELVPFSSSDRVTVGERSIDRTSWENERVTVHIKRGRWLRQNGSMRFVSVEDEDASGDWQGASSNLGIPKLAVTNAIQVSISMRPDSFLIPGRGSRVERISVATSSAVGTASVAPFAIPVCRILEDYVGAPNGPGSAQSDRICYAERYFTGTERFGTYVSPEVPFPLEVTPDFHYRAEVAGDSLPPRPTQCNWADRYFPRRVDHFGVIGLVGNTQPDEEAIANLFVQGDGLQHDVAIGDSFSLMNGSLEDPRTADLIWQRISPDSGIQTDSGFQSGTNVGLHQTDLVRHVPTINMVWREEYFRTCVNSPGGTFGVCDSRRFELRARDGVCEAGFVPSYDCPNGNCEAGSVWRVLLPVIADPNAPTPCSGTQGQLNNDYEILPESQFEIVGFVPATIFDVDIGTPPPAYPIGCSPDPTRFMSMPWGFMPPGGGATRSCNLIRGRIDCDISRMLFSKEKELNPSPVLVK